MDISERVQWFSNYFRKLFFRSIPSLRAKVLYCILWIFNWQPSETENWLIFLNPSYSEDSLIQSQNLPSYSFLPWFLLLFSSFKDNTFNSSSGITFKYLKTVLPSLRFSLLSVNNQNSSIYPLGMMWLCCLIISVRL